MCGWLPTKSAAIHLSGGWFSIVASIHTFSAVCLYIFTNVYMLGLQVGL